MSRPRSSVSLSSVTRGGLRRRCYLPGVLLAILAVLMVASGHAQPIAHGDLEIADGWARATAPSAPGAGYLTIVNTGSGQDRLVSASMDGAEVQLHSMVSENGVMKMRHLHHGREVPAGVTVAFQPGGDHLMLMGLATPLVEGETLQIELNFEAAGRITVPFQVLAPGASAHPHAGHGKKKHDANHGSGHDSKHNVN